MQCDTHESLTENEHFRIARNQRKHNLPDSFPLVVRTSKFIFQPFSKELERRTDELICTTIVKWLLLPRATTFQSFFSLEFLNITFIERAAIDANVMVYISWLSSCYDYHIYCRL